MIRFLLLMGLLVAPLHGLCAQEWTVQDSLRLQQLLRSKGEIKLNPDALRELGVPSTVGTPRPSESKSWLRFDATLPAIRTPYREKVQANMTLPMPHLTTTVRPSGIDLMTPFTRQFWDRAGNSRRARTLEVLRSYGDSTTALWNLPLPSLYRRP